VFQQTWESGTSAAWQQFIAAHPSLAHADEARAMPQEAVDFELALASDTATMWRAFVRPGPRAAPAGCDIRLPREENDGASVARRLAGWTASGSLAYVIS